MSAVAVSYVVEGAADAPALVLSGSLGSSLEIWDPVLPGLAGRFRVVRYDLRGHGRSPVPPGPYAIEDLGADLIALLDTLDVARAYLAGISIGGMASLWVAAHAPDRVAGLVAVCTSAHLASGGAYAERAAAVRAHGTALVAPAVVGRWLTAGLRARDPGLVRELEAMVAATPAEGYAGCCEALEAMDLRPDLGRIAAPTLVVAGSGDVAIPPDHGARLAAAIAGAGIAVLEGAAHLPTVERPAELADLLVGYLAPLDGSGIEGRPGASAAPAASIARSRGSAE